MEIGPVPELPNISIDNFDGCNYLSTCFFLSHCHTDHMKGLGPTFFNFLKNNSEYYLYCSPHTKNILLRGIDFENTDLLSENDFIKEIEEKMLITVPGRDDTNTVSYLVTVTAIPVYHCLGSVMYLFETTRTAVLYTGDFRIIKGDTPKYKDLLVYCHGFNKLDKVYLDTTFLNTDYWEFPNISESLHQIIKIIRNWLDADPNNHVNIKKSAQYGYEYVLIKVAQTFRCLIHVDEILYKVYSRVPEIGRRLTISPTETRIHCCKSSTKSIKCDSPKLCTVKLSAQKFKSTDSLDCEIVTGENNRYDVCYATHCSLSEIIDFLDHLRPKSIEPLTCAVDSSNENMENLLSEIRSKWYVGDD